MFDLVVKNGEIIDGTGKSRFRGDVGVAAGRIAAVGDLGTAVAGRVVDARGLAVAPGFIDVHSHHDLYLTGADAARRFESYLRQGVTTCVTGNCGWGLAPCPPGRRDALTDWLRTMCAPVDRIEWSTTEELFSYLGGRRLPANVAVLAGHGTIRLAIMGHDGRPCTPNELESMKALLRTALEAGCVGLSSGLMYDPGMYARTDELIELARVAAACDRPYVTHLRGYCSTLPQSTAEAIHIAQQAGARLQISHLHAVPFFGRLADLANAGIGVLERINAALPLPSLPSPPLTGALRALERAADEGTDIGFDVVPYTLGNTTASALFPPWATRGGRKMLLDRLRDPAIRPCIRRDLRSTTPRWPHWENDFWSDPYLRALGWKPVRVLSVRTDDNRWTEGRSFPEIGRVWGTDPFDALCRLTCEEEGELTFTFGYTARPWLEKMLHGLLLHRQASIGADAVLPLEGTPPPSAHGCFARILGRFSRELGLFSLEEAVRKMTSLPASQLGIEGRGELRRGASADLVVFHPGEVGDRIGDDGQPRPASGIRCVLVNGVPVVTEGRFDPDAHPGAVIRHA